MEETVLIKRDGNILKQISSNWSGYIKDSGLFVFVSVGDKNSTQLTFMDKNAKIVDRSKNILKTTVYRVNGSSDIMPTFRLIIFTNEKNSKYQIMIKDLGTQFAKVIGYGKVSFSNNAVSLSSKPLVVDDRFIYTTAGIGNDTRKVFNLYDLKNGKFVFNDFFYNIDVNTEMDCFDVQPSRSSEKILQYDYDGNPLDKNKKKTIDFPKDRLRRIKIAGKYDYWLIKVSIYTDEYAIYSGYDYDKEIFTGKICSMDQMFAYYKNEGVSIYGKNNIITKNNIFSQREYNTPYDISREEQLVVFRDMDSNLCKLDTSGDVAKPVIIYKAGEDTLCGFENLYIGDNGTVIISAMDKSEGKTHFIRDDGTIIYSDTRDFTDEEFNSNVSKYTYNSLEGMTKIGYFKRGEQVEMEDGNITNIQKYFYYKDGKLTDVKLPEDLLPIHDNSSKLYNMPLQNIKLTIIGYNHNVYTFDCNFNQIEDDNLQTVAYYGMYITLDKKEDICYVSDEAKILKKYSIGNYRPKRIKKALDRLYDAIHQRDEIIAFYASRLDENGNEKWSFFCSDVYGDNNSDEMFQIGEYDSIKLYHKKNDWYSSKTEDHIQRGNKTSLSKNIFECENKDGDTKYISIGYNKDGTLKEVYKSKSSLQLKDNDENDWF